MSILPKNTNEALDLIDRAEAEKSDFIEVRLDRLKSLEGLADLAERAKAPKIATMKPLAHRGNFEGTEAEQKQILLAAAKNGFDYVDIDLGVPDAGRFMKEARDHGAKIIVSYHDHNLTPKRAELAEILDRERASGADLCKIVTTARKLEDNLTLLNFITLASKNSAIVCFAMGELGKVSRLLSPLFGGFLAFAALEHGNETAPGQMTLREMRAAYRVLGV